MKSSTQVHVIYLVIIAVLFASGAFGAFRSLHEMVMPMEQQREMVVAMKGHMHGELLPVRAYRCCLDKPCSKCLEKTPGHGIGATCDCLADIMNGKHPCGECIGEIMEGHGNPLISEYFAAAIAEEVGERYKPMLMEFVAERYGMPIERQL
ncbi:MAG: hypothetical protein MAG794_00542 [Gammaproteobacteria bacterium]|nr:hypothetical protein [Gammaproteobacteria bacterium]